LQAKRERDHLSPNPGRWLEPPNHIGIKVLPPLSEKQNQFADVGSVLKATGPVAPPFLEID
jgi:hypothetical protein